MRWFKTKHLLFLTLVLYTGTVSACPFAKLVREAEKDKKDRFSRSTGFDSLPSWTSDSAQRETNIVRWETKLLAETETSWKRLGVQYVKIPYGKGYALKVLETGDTPLNRMARDATAIANKTKYPFQMVFSPRSLLREWDKEQLFYAVGGSFRRDTHTIHLPLISADSPNLNPTFHHEFLHAIFDYWREHGTDSIFHGSFHARKDGAMWKGPHYTDYMSLEELATFPLNLKFHAAQLKSALDNFEDPETARWPRELLESFYRHALNNAVNSRHARTAFGHALRHLKSKTGQVATTAVLRRTKVNGALLLEAHFKHENIRYEMRITEDSINAVLPSSRQFLGRTVSTLPQPARGTLEMLIKERLQAQYAMAREASDVARPLILKIAELRERPKDKPITRKELEELVLLLEAPRKTTLPYIVGR